MRAPAFSDPGVEAVFEAYPEPLRAALFDLRALVFETADGPLTESLKWGQPAYRRPKGGTTVRIDAVKGSASEYALYVHCQTSLAATFRDLYGDVLRIESDRAVLMSVEAPPPREALAHCIALALAYSGRR